MYLNGSRPYVGAGTSSADIFSAAFGAVSDQAGGASIAAGSIADYLIRAGYSVAAVSGILGDVSQMSAATPQMLNAAALEQSWLSQYQADRSRNNWVFPVAIGVFLIWLANRKE